MGADSLQHVPNVCFGLVYPNCEIPNSNLNSACMDEKTKRLNQLNILHQSVQYKLLASWSLLLGSPDTVHLDILSGLKMI